MAEVLNTVVLLHGLGRTSWSMAHLGILLKRKSYEVLNFGYRSRHKTISEQAAALNEFLSKRITQDSNVSFVTHSLGSIIVRAFATTYGKHYKLSRAVMLGPPNQGSKIARYLSRWKISHAILGPALPELANLNIPHASDVLEIGVIAAGTGTARGITPFFKEDNDGIVTVAETSLPGAKDAVIVRGLHSFLMYSPTVMRLVVSFLEKGKFN